MAHHDDSMAVTEEQVDILARLAALPLDPRRRPMLAGALEADLRLIGTLRGIDAGDIFPASPQQPCENRRDGR